MSASAIDLHDYVHALRASIPYVHPAGRATIDDWLREMHEAADHGDTATFAKLALLIAEKVNRELQWYAEDTEFLSSTNPGR